jgi:23S rRNA pseudouridine2605 synthase
LPFWLNLIEDVHYLFGENTEWVCPFTEIKENMKKKYYKKTLISPPRNEYPSLIRIISKFGYCSRTEGVKLVQAGRVSINGQKVEDPGYSVNLQDRIMIDGQLVKNQKKVYIAFNKPAGYVTTRQDERGRETVYSFFKDVKEWIFPVGRLDKDSEGLLLFTNDSLFSESMANPYNGVKRTYHVQIEGNLNPQEIQFILKGVDISKGEISKPLSLDFLSSEDNKSWFKIVLVEGKSREIRRLFMALGKLILRLIRVQFGPYMLDNLQPGEWKYIEVEHRLTSKWSTRKVFWPKTMA